MVNRSELHHIWDPEIYPEKYHEYILILIEKFNLCMRVKDKSQIFFPELLEEEPTPSLANMNLLWSPGYEMEEPEYRRVFNYQYFPANLFPRIVGQISFSMTWDIQNYFKNCCILSHNSGNSAFLKIDPFEKKLFLTVRGMEAGSFITKMIDLIQQLNENVGLADVEAFVPCTHCLLLEEDAKPYLFPMIDFDKAMIEGKEYVLCQGEVAVKLRALLPNAGQPL